jgi:hypothetical protein
MLAFEEKTKIEIQNSIVPLQTSISALTKLSKINPFVLRPSSELYRIERFIREQGQMVTLDAVMVGIGVAGDEETKKKRKKSLRGSLGQYARKGNIFTTGESDTFGLLNFRENILTEIGQQAKQNVIGGESR